MVGFKILNTESHSNIYQVTKKKHLLYFIKLLSSKMRATCTKTAAHTWHADAIWKLLLFRPKVACRRRLESDLDERSLSQCTVYSQ